MNQPPFPITAMGTRPGGIIPLNEKLRETWGCVATSGSTGITEIAVNGVGNLDNYLLYVCFGPGSNFVPPGVSLGQSISSGPNGQVFSVITYRVYDGTVAPETVNLPINWFIVKKPIDI